MRFLSLLSHITVGVRVIGKIALTDKELLRWGVVTESLSDEYHRQLKCGKHQASSYFFRAPWAAVGIVCQNFGLRVFDFMSPQFIAPKR
jgi:hypothetical protein